MIVFLDIYCFVLVMYVMLTLVDNTEEDHGDKAKKENREPVRKGKDQEKDVGKASDKQTGSKKEVEKKEGKATELSEDDDSKVS